MPSVKLKPTLISKTERFTASPGRVFAHMGITLSIRGMERFERKRNVHAVGTFRLRWTGITGKKACGWFGSTASGTWDRTRRMRNWHRLLRDRNRWQEGLDFWDWRFMSRT